MIKQNEHIICLLGYMATGKTTLGKAVAERLGVIFVDLDQWIVDKERKSVSHIFRTKGEQYFRQLEQDYLETIINLDSQKKIIALGGGTACQYHIWSLLETVWSIYLKTNVNILIDRLESQKEQRPLISNIDDDLLSDFIKKHVLIREKFYKQSDITVQLDADMALNLILLELKIKQLFGCQA